MGHARPTSLRTGRVLRLAVVALPLAVLVVLATRPTPALAQDLEVAGTVTFDAGPSGILTLDGDRRYRDRLELVASRDLVVNELATEHYVAGVAEMPSRWPSAALRAQAVAARTYAWYVATTGVYDGYDICATTACQVYRGVEAELDEGRVTAWRAAVDATAGEVLLHEGQPILARYFSTSGGRTYANEEAFTSDDPRPYLVSIDDPFDEVSPYHRWTVRFTRDEFDEVLSRGETLAATVPIAGVERIGAVDDPAATLRVTGQDGTVVEVGAVEFARFASQVAPARFPDRFPSARADGLRPLPSTVPSSRFAPEVTDTEVVLTGRGWGHGVGLGQYGARGRAAAGESYLDILAAYYGGLRPTVAADLPDTIRVGLDAADEHRIAGDGPVVIRAAGQVVVDRAIGTWTARRTDGGWRLTPPDRHDATVAAAPTVRLDGLSTAERVVVETEVDQPVLLDLEVVDPAGEVVYTRPLGSAAAGRHAASWGFEDAQGAPVAPGAYEVVIVAEDAGGRRAGTPTTVVVGAPDAAVGPGPRSAGDPLLRRPVAIVAAAAAAAALLAVIGAGRRAKDRS